MKKMLTAAVISVLFAGVFFSCRAIAQEAAFSITAHNAVILFMEGDVQIKQATTGEWIKAKEEMALYPGDILKTGDGSWVEIGVGSGYKNVMRVQENTLVELTSLRPVETSLLKGELRALVEELSKNETFEIKTPMSVCGVRGTGWDITTDGKKVIVDAYEGAVYFAAVSQEGAPMEDPIINAGQRGILPGPKKPINIIDLPFDKMRNWNNWKKGFMERRGAAKGIKGKLGGKGGAIENMMKGKKGIFEQKDQENVDKRTDNSGGVGYP